MTQKYKAKGVVLVTGGAKRIGRAICLSLASTGYKVALHYHHSASEAEKTAKVIRQKRGVCNLFPCDLSDQKQTVSLIDNVLRKFKGLDVLINNASIFEPSTIKNSPLESLNQHFSVNFNAPYILTSQFAKKIKKGQIINILDTHIVRNKTQHTAYLLSKKALSALTKLSAIELAPHFRVNGIAPGLIISPANTKSGYLDRLAKKIPLKKKGDVGQIIQSIEFLLNNSYLTGQIIFNDGGEHLT